MLLFVIKMIQYLVKELEEARELLKGYVESKSLGELLGRMPISPISLEKMPIPRGLEKTLADVFEGNAVLVRSSNGFNVVIIGNTGVMKDPKTRLMKPVQKLTMYTLFPKPVSGREARTAYDGLSRIQ